METDGKLRGQSHKQFVADWKKSMQEVFRLAKERSGKIQSYNKGKYDKKVREIEIKEGDHVLVKNLRERGGTGKLRSTWEHQIFEVVRQQGDLPVYHVRNLDKPRDVRVLHRNHLLKCDELPLDVFKDKPAEEKMEEKKEKPVRRSTGKKPSLKKGVVTARNELEETDSDEDGEYHMVLYPETNEAAYEEMETDELNDGPNEERVVVSSDDVVEVSDLSAAEESTVEEPEGMNHQVMDEEVEEEDDEESEEDEPAPRRSLRQRTTKKTYTYTKLGGNPTYKEST